MSGILKRHMHMHEVLRCPAARARGSSQDSLVRDHEVLVSAYDRYPIFEEVPDLRLPNDRAGTSYDEILPHLSGEEDESVIGSLLMSMEVMRGDIDGKRVLVAGVGCGTELNMILRFAPAEIYVIDFSNYVAQLNVMPRYRSRAVQFVMGDLCNLPFRENSFDYIISSGIIHHTRSPELAFRNLWSSLRPGGIINFGHIYGQNVHNRLVSFGRWMYEYHKLKPAEAKVMLQKRVRVTTALMRMGLSRLVLRLIPHFGLLELGNPRALYEQQLRSAYDYYLCTYRHNISADEVFDWFRQVGGEARRTKKGYIGRKPSS